MTNLQRLERIEFCARALMKQLHECTFDPPEEGTIDITAHPDEVPSLLENLTALDAALRNTADGD